MRVESPEGGVVKCLGAGEQRRGCQDEVKALSFSGDAGKMGKNAREKGRLGRGRWSKNGMLWSSYSEPGPIFFCPANKSWFWLPMALVSTPRRQASPVSWTMWGRPLPRARVCCPKPHTSLFINQHCGFNIV